jgi:hypothetical protein
VLRILAATVNPRIAGVAPAGHRQDGFRRRVFVIRRDPSGRPKEALVGLALVPRSQSAWHSGLVWVNDVGFFDG